MINFLISIILGLVPEVLFITLMTTSLENVDKKRVKLFILLAFGYILLIMICRFELQFYVLYIIYTYLIIKRLYNVHISSFFMISLVFSYIALLSFICSNIPNYALAYIIDRTFLFIPLFYCSYFKYLYMLYKKCWNRNATYKIKSITLRNCSLVFINSMIIILDILLMLCSLYLSKL